VIKHILFDLDETLYPSDIGLWPVLGERMNHFMHTRLGIPLAEVEARREHYFHTYGTSLRGLQADYGVDAMDYLDFVHDVPIEDFIHQDLKLETILSELPCDKVIFTNSTRKHSKRVLDALGISRFFSMIIDVVDMEPFCKPQPGAFEIAMRIVGDHIPGNYLLVDDSLRNVKSAINLGMPAILVTEADIDTGPIIRIKNIHDIDARLLKIGTDGAM